MSEFTEELLVLAKTKPADVSAIGISIMANHIEELQARAEAAERELAELKERTRWIPVGERLPDDADLALVFFVHRFETAFYAYQWWASDGDELEFQPTHWMPLPKPPKEND